MSPIPAVPLDPDYRYVPMYAFPDATQFVQRLAPLHSGTILRRMAHIVDPRASLRIDVEAEFLSDPEIREHFGLPPESAAALAQIQKVAAALDEITRRRVKASNDPVKNRLRVEGEKKQADVSHPIATVSSEERERLDDQQELWTLCGVSIDIEFSPHAEVVDGPVDSEAEEFHKNVTGGRHIDTGDELAAKMRQERIKEGFCDFAFPLALAQRDIPAQLEAVARRLGGTGLFGREGPLAVSFVRELRFYGHGQHGRVDAESGKTIHAGFGFDGSIIETPLLLDSTQKELFKRVPAFMAPGSSVLFEGCDTGDGDLGKEFMKAIGHLFFGAEKWGYIRANTVVTHLDPINRLAGFADGRPKTYMWQNDF